VRQSTRFSSVSVCVCARAATTVAVLCNIIENDPYPRGGKELGGGDAAM
jgi:hypothetical protein